MLVRPAGTTYSRVKVPYIPRGATAPAQRQRAGTNAAPMMKASVRVVDQRLESAVVGSITAATGVILSAGKPDC